jgi:hypothetical protein
MSRVAVHRRLPPLAKMLEQFEGFVPTRSRHHVMTKELRQVAKVLRRTKPQPFYSMREVAQFFKAPLGGVSIAFQVLEREGLLNRIRGSQTLLMGKSVLPKDAVRGVVGIPIWFHSMMVLPYTQTFAKDTEEQLRHAGYVADIIFHHKKGEETDPDFAARLLQHRLDVIIFHTPLPGCRQNILSLRERGIRVMVLQRTEAPRRYPSVIYLLDFQTAYENMVKRWREVGITKVWLWSPLARLSYRSEADLFSTIMRSRGLEVELIEDQPLEVLKKIRQSAAKSKGKNAVAFLDTIHCESVCNCEPQVIEQISRIARLAFCLGRIRIPYLEHRCVPIDIVEHSPAEIASRLVNDICRLSILPDGVCHTFPAYYREQVLDRATQSGT